MPFAITCPACQHKFRTAKEREIGKGVQCAECGDQFYISAKNQEEDRESKSGPPPVPKKSSSTRSRNRNPEKELDEHDVPSAKPRQKKKLGKVLLVLSFFGFVMFAAAGTGVYFAFFRGSSSAEHMVQPKRQLPMDMLMYMPSKGSQIEYCSFEMLRQKEYGKTSNIPKLTDAFPAGAGITGDQLVAYCSLSNERAHLVGPTAQVFQFLIPQDIAQVAASCKMQLIPGNGRPVYSDRAQGASWWLFQPEPKKLVFVRTNTNERFDRPKLMELADRNLETYQFSELLREGLEAVSGYPIIKAVDRMYTRDGEIGKAEFSGTLIDEQGTSEKFTVYAFHGEGPAKGYYGRKREKLQNPKQNVGVSHEWIRKDKVYLFTQQNLTN